MNITQEAKKTGNKKTKGSYARSVYPTQDTSRMGTTRVKEEEEADTKIIVKERHEICMEGTWAL